MTHRREKLVSFATQACCGVIMAFYQVGLESALSGTIYHNQCRMALAHYLNECWMSLLRENDEFVVSNFDTIGHSPVCVINILFAVGSQALPSSPFVIETSDGTPGFTNDIDARRNLVSAILKSSLEKQIPEDMLEHQCNGLTMEQARKEWRAGGSQDEQFFTLASQPIN